MAPLTAWMLLTMALRRMADSHARGVLGTTLLFQWTGLAFNATSLIVIWTEGSRGGEAGIGAALLILALLFIAMLCSIIGVIILSVSLLRAGDID